MAAIAAVALTAGLAPIWAGKFFLGETGGRVSALAGMVQELEARIAEMMEPDYTTVVTTGGLDHTVKTYCSTAPAGTSCGAYHRQKIEDLREAFPDPVTGSGQ